MVGGQEVEIARKNAKKKEELKTYLSSKTDSVPSDRVRDTPRERPDWGRGRGKDYDWIPSHKGNDKGKGKGKDNNQKGNDKSKGRDKWVRKSKKNKKRKRSQSS